MLEALSGLQGFNNLNSIGTGNINKLDNFMIQNDDIQGPEDIKPNNEGINKIDFSKISNDDLELKADLKGLVEKNQSFDDNSQFDKSEITTGEVAHKFSNVLGNYINSINEKNRDAEKAVETFASGGNIDMHTVMIASEKANLSMQLAVQMKNKILQAYQEISRMQV